MELNEQLKIVAEFMELKGFEDDRYGWMWKDPTSDKNGSCFALKYNKSYDWLIPVWVKFRDLDFNIINQHRWDFEELGKYTMHRKIRESIVQNLAYCEIEKAFSNLVEGIVWYNELKLCLKK